jgi:hypothetical protein
MRRLRPLIEAVVLAVNPVPDTITSSGAEPIAYSPATTDSGETLFIFGVIAGVPKICAGAGTGEIRAPSNTSARANIKVRILRLLSVEADRRKHLVMSIVMSQVALGCILWMPVALTSLVVQRATGT